MTHYVVVINEQHSIMPDQERLLTADGSTFERLNIPAAGLTLDEIEKLAGRLEVMHDVQEKEIVVASPIPALMVALAFREHCNFLVFHNDKRDAKEVPDGNGGVKVIHTVAQTGWQLY